MRGDPPASTSTYVRHTTALRTSMSQLLIGHFLLYVIPRSLCIVLFSSSRILHQVHLLSSPLPLPHPFPLSPATDRPGEQWESRQVMPFGCSGGPVLALHKKAYTVVGMLSAGQPDR